MPETDVRRVLVAGDWHGNRDHARHCFEVAAASGCQALLQLGDYGLWPGREDEWLDLSAALVDRTGIGLIWVDGNHENHDLLDDWMGEVTGRGPLSVRPGVSWAWRGARWTWSGLNFGALGGAVSIDRFLRRRQVNWWPQEATSPDDLERLGHERLDVLATHDLPAGSASGPVRRLPLPPDIIREAREVRDLLEEAVRRTRPRLVVHGHHHIRRRVEVDGRVVEGLAHDKAKGSDSYAVLDLEAFAGERQPALRMPADPVLQPPPPAP